MAKNFWDEVEEMAENAPEAGFPSLQYGKLTIVPWVVTFKGKGETPDRSEFKGGALKDRQVMELVFNVEIEELNPSLKFTYDRKVTMRKSRGKNKEDWSETTLPSLVAVFGNDWAHKADGTYVEVEDVPQVDNEEYNTIKFLRKFKDLKECKAVHTKTYTSQSVDVEAGDIPAEVVEQAKGLIDSIGDDAARKALESMPFGDYDPDAVIAAANPL